MNDITFNKLAGGLGRTLPSQDHYSGLIFYTEANPSGFGVDKIKEITSLSHAESLGITADASDMPIKVLHYHLKRFFAVYDYLGAKAKLWLMVAPKSDETAFESLKQVSDYSDGTIRNFGVFSELAYTTANITKLSAMATALDAKHAHCSAIYACDFSGVNDLTTTINPRSCDAPKVTVTIGQDGNGEGAALFAEYGKSVTDLGSALAWAGLKKVSECWAWVEKFNVAFDGEFDVPALSNGQLIKEVDDFLTGLNDKGFVFLRKIVGTAGTFFNDSHCCVEITSDYAYLENNQVIDKAQRLTYAGLVKKLNSSISIDPDSGQIDRVTISILEDAANSQLQQMVKDGEVSAASVSIDPDQDVLATSTIEVTILLVINGVARKIVVNIGFTKKLES
ncbi:DUF2586 family protein [Bacteroidales bacterium OttesenSCG-928-C19]|nr:DUF2586 family protein [Bacteroidales bacterium OttesenSCG-928-C19]